MSLEDSQPIEYRPLFELVLDRLRRSILSGQLPAGSFVHQEKLAKDLGVSRMPVREALRMLAREGLVEIKRNVGVRVVDLSFRQLEEVYLMRQALESVAARLAAPEATDEDISYLASLLDQIAAETRARNSTKVLDLNTQFHRYIYALAKKPRLQRAIDDLRNNSLRYRHVVSALPQRLTEVLDEHRAIFEGCRRRDPDAAAQAVHVHYGRTLEAVRRFLVQGDLSHLSLDDGAVERAGS